MQIRKTRWFVKGAVDRQPGEADGGRIGAQPEPAAAVQGLRLRVDHLHHQGAVGKQEAVAAHAAHLDMVGFRGFQRVQAGGYEGDASRVFFDVTILTQFLLESGLPNGLVDILTGMIANVADLVWKSGIQILIFMAALLSIPSSFYEVAQVEGASGWETFWKITFPTVSPFVLATIVYTIIDCFTSYDNQAMRYIRDYFMKDMNYSYAAAMAWMYFLLVLIILGLVVLLCRRMLFQKER